MKVFWSWQSDTPGKIGRFLIRDALHAAIDQLKEAPDIEEPTAKESREALHLDHDIQGVTGSPDLARTILGKIDRSALVIADITLVGKVPDSTGSDGKTVPGKKLINSNVAIELGYALHRLTDANILMVFNRYYGTHEDLPFDLRHKGGAIDFILEPGAPKSRIDEESKKLKDRFVLALRPYLQKTSVAPIAFDETQSTFCKAVYFQERESLAEAGRRGDDEVTYLYTTDRLCYVRLIPTVPLAQSVALAKLVSVAQRVPLLTKDFNVLRAQNNYGAMGYQPMSRSSGTAVPLAASTQLFQNGEFWSLNAKLIVTDRNGRPEWLQLPCIASMQFEQTYYDAVHALKQFAAEQLDLRPPWQIECGLTGTKGLQIYGLTTGIYANESLGPVRKSESTTRKILNDDKKVSVDQILVEFFREVYDCVGHVRPDRLHGFPPSRPS